MALIPSVLIPPDPALSPEEEARLRLQRERDAEAGAENTAVSVLVPPEIPDTPPPADVTALAFPPAQDSGGSGGAISAVLQQERDDEARQFEQDQVPPFGGIPVAPTALPDTLQRLYGGRELPSSDLSDVVAAAHSDPTAPPLGPLGQYSPRQIQVLRNQLGMDRGAPTPTTALASSQPAEYIRQIIAGAAAAGRPDPNNPLDALNALPAIAGPTYAVTGGNPALKFLLGMAGQDVVDVGADIARAGGRAAAQVGRAGDVLLTPPDPSAVRSQLLTFGGADRLGDDATRQVQRLDSELERLSGVIEDLPPDTPEYQAVLDQIEALETRKAELGGRSGPAPNLQAEIDGIEAAIAENRSARALRFIPRSGNFKGEIPETITVKQFRDIMGHNPRSPAKNGRIEWHIAIDEMADEAGMSTDEFNESIRQLQRDRRRAESLREELRRADETARTAKMPEQRAVPEQPAGVDTFEAAGERSLGKEPSQMTLAEFQASELWRLAEQHIATQSAPDTGSAGRQAGARVIAEVPGAREAAFAQAKATWDALQRGEQIVAPGNIDRSRVRFGPAARADVDLGAEIAERHRRAVEGASRVAAQAQTSAGETTVGNIQSGMGIGEPAPQGTLFDNLRGEGQAAPLAEPKPIAQAVPEGQAVLPSTDDLTQQINEKVWYHGSGTPDMTADRLDPFYGNHESLFGHGIYMTDDPEVASTYAKTRSRRTGTPATYEAQLQIDRALDMEAPITPDVADIIRRGAVYVDPQDGDNIVAAAVEAALANPDATPATVIKAMRTAISDYSHEMEIPTSEFVEVFQDLSAAFREGGYDALVYQGGVRTGNKRHQAIVLLDPNDVNQVGRGGQVKQFGLRAEPPAPISSVDEIQMPTAPANFTNEAIPEIRPAIPVSSPDATTSGSPAPAVTTTAQAGVPSGTPAWTPPTTPGQSPNVNAALAAVGAPPLPPVKPPRGRGKPPAGGTPAPAAPAAAPLPKFSPEVERGLVHAHNLTGIDEPALRYAVAQASLPANHPGQIRSFFNTVGSVINEALRRNPDVQSSYVAATRYAQAQNTRVAAEVNLTERMVLEAFGDEAMSGTKVPDLVARYVGTSPMNDYIGTGWHVLQRADDYDLTPLQRRAVNEWKQIADDDLHFTQTQLKVPIGEVQDVYVAHAFKDPDAAQAAMLSGAGSVGNRGVPGVARNRNLSVEGYIQFAEKHGLEIETNLSVLLAKRLAATAKLRTNGIFLEELAKKTGGKRLPPFQGPQIATPNIIRNGAQQWQFPAAIAQEINALNTAPDPSMLVKAVDGAVDAARGALLNLDFSVGGGRQAFEGFLIDPIGYARSMRNAYNIGADSEFGWLKWYNDNIERLMDGQQHGLNLSSLNITDVATALPGESLPLYERGRFNPIRKLNEIQFKMIMPEMKIGRYETVFEALKLARDNKGVDAMINKLPVFGAINRKLGGRLYTMTDDELKEVAAEAVNNMLGGIEWAKVGHAPNHNASGVLRKIAILTEGWTRAQMGLLTRAAQANPEGYVARRLLMSEVAMISGISTGLSLALSGQLPEYDPRANEWLDVVTPWGYVQILPHKSALQFAIKSLAGNKPGEYGSDQSALKQRWDTLAHFVSGRAGQIPRVAGELRTEKDYYDDPITDYPAYFAQTFSPIIVGRVLRGIQQGQEPTGIAVRTGEEFLGFAGRPFPKSKPGGETVAGLPEYNTRHEAVAEYLGAGDQAKTDALKLYARLDKQYDQLQFTEGIETATKRVGPQLDALKAKIEQEYGEELLTQYRRGVKQVEDGMARENPALKSYLESVGKTFKEPTTTPTGTATKVPTPGEPTPTATSTKVPQPANTPRPNATWTVDYSKDQVGQRMADAWGRKDGTGKALLYDQLASFERKAVDEFMDKLNSVALAQEKKEWRAVPSGATKEALILQTLQQFYGGQWPQPPQPTPTRTATPRSTGTPTRTPTPDVYDALRGATPTPAGTR